MLDINFGGSINFPAPPENTGWVGAQPDYKSCPLPPSQQLQAVLLDNLETRIEVLIDLHQ